CHSRCPSSPRPPARLRLREAGPAIDEWPAAGPTRALLVAGTLVDLDRPLVDHHAVVLQGATGGQEAAGHVLAHALGIPCERVTPAAAAAGLEPEQIAAPELDPVAESGRLTLAGPAWIEDAASRPSRRAAGPPVGRRGGVLHASGEPGALAEHPRAADAAGPATVIPRAAGVGPHRVLLDAQG